MLCKLSSLPAQPFTQVHWATQLPEVVASPFGQKGPEDILHSGRGYIKVPLAGWEEKGLLQTLFQICTGGNRLCLPASPLEHCWATLLPGLVISPAGQMGPEGTLLSGWGCELALA